MKLKINTKVIRALNPCNDRFKNWLYYYEHRNFTLKQFLALDQITHRDKLWVVLRLIPNEMKVVFALDCCFSAANAAYAADAAYAAADANAAANAAYAADAAYAAADANAAANAAAYAAADAAADAAYAAYAAEQKRQIEALIYLIGGN